MRGDTGCLIMLNKILSGGQTGSDQGGWRAAQAFGVQTGGWMPRGFLTENGPRPDFAERFGAGELQADSGPTEPESNVQDSDATLWFGETTTSVAHTTVATCLRLGKPCLPVSPAALFEPSQVAAWIEENKIKTLNVAGSGESEEPGIGDWVESFLRQVLQQLGHQRSRRD
jgi:hypothetical protein